MAREIEGAHSICSGQKTPDATVEAAWTALRAHGRAGVGRPRKDAQAPTLAQLGLTKWMARKALALAGVTDDHMDAIAAGTPGQSVTALLESKRGRRRNPLVRAWRVATHAERAAFVLALKRAEGLAERAAAVADLGAEDG